jgi:hypothetical protein
MDSVDFTNIREGKKDLEIRNDYLEKTGHF